jgi:hypothetical protein
MQLTTLDPAQRQLVRALAADPSDGELLFAVGDVLIECDPRLAELDIDTRLVAAAVTGLAARGDEIGADGIAALFGIDREDVRDAFDYLKLLRWQPPL